MKADANAEAGGLSPNAREGRAWLRTASACSKLLVAADVQDEQDARARVQSVPSLFHALASPVAAGPFGVPARPGSPPRTTIAGIHRARRTSPPKHPLSSTPSLASECECDAGARNHHKDASAVAFELADTTLLPIYPSSVHPAPRAGCSRSSSCARERTTTGPGPLRAYVTPSTKYALEAHRSSGDAPLTLAPSGSGIASSAPSTL